MIRDIRNSFVSGEIAPTLHGRHDLKAYFSGAEQLLNFIVRKAGGLQKRAGTDLTLDLSAFPEHRLLPFYYDRTRSTLILLTHLAARFITRQPDGRLAITTLGSEHYTLATPWPADILPSVKAYQMGDTVFLSAPGYQVRRLARYTDASWTLTTMTGKVTVPAPPALAATTDKMTWVEGLVPTTTQYALFAVRQGIYSAPGAIAVKTYTPWPAGASVTLSFTPALSSGVDGYVLGKKVGQYYGVLATFYPYVTVIGSGGKGYPLTTSGVSTQDPAPAYRFSTNHSNLGTSGDATEQVSLLIRLNAYACHIARLGAAAPYATYTSGTAFALSEVRLWLGATTADADKQDAVTADYANATVRITLQRLVASTWTLIGSASVPYATGAGGYISVPVTAYTSTLTSLRVTIDPPDTQETGVICRGIALLNRATPAAYVTSGTWALPTGPATDYDYYCRGVYGWTSLATYYAAATLEVTSDANATARSDLADKACSPARTIANHTYAAALTTASGVASVSLLAPVSGGAPFAVTEVRIWLGARVCLTPSYVPGQRDTLFSNTASAKFKYTTNRTDWTVIDITYALTNQYSDEYVSLYLPFSSVPVDGSGDPTPLGWGLDITALDPAAPVILRCVKFYESTCGGSYVDINHIPTEIIPTQTYIAPGSLGMDCDLVCMFQQRLILAASLGLPFTLWASKLGDIGGFYADRPVTDTDPFSATIPATRSTKILNMVSDKRLILFTEGGIYTFDGSDSDGLSYRTVRMVKVANCGACAVDPVAGQNTILYVQDDERTLTELSYDITQDSIIPIERSVLASHLTESSPITRMAWQAAPNAVLWVLLADGTLLSFTYLPEHEVYAWARHLISGVDRVTDILAPGSVSSAPDTETSTDLHLTATAGAKTLLLTLRQQISSDLPAVSAAACLDAAQTLSIDATGTVVEYTPPVEQGPGTPPPGFAPRIAYRDGQTVTALNLATGAAHTLTSGPTAAQPDVPAGYLYPTLPEGSYILGIPVPATLKTLRPELPERNIQGLRKTITDTLLRVHRARSVSVCPSDPSTGLAEITHIADDIAPVSDGRVPLYSGDILTIPSGSWNTDGRLTARSADPWPCEILSVIQTLETEGR